MSIICHRHFYLLHYRKSLFIRRFSVIRPLNMSENSRMTNNTNNFLLKELIHQIKFSGPLTVNDYMRLSLTHPKYGFYMKQDVFGQKGHFITSPEISQMFGELIAIWILYNWQQYSNGLPLDVIELGPGRGTLSSDLARVMSQFSKQNEHQCRFHLVEISPYLRSIQQKNLCGSNKCLEQEDEIQHSKTIYDQPITWYRSFEQIPLSEYENKRFQIFVANEFFDAFPIHKFIRNTKKQWRELLIDYDEQQNELRWIQAKHETPIIKLLASKYLLQYFDSFTNVDHLEFSPQALATIEKIVDRINRNEYGCLLICDYGYDDQNKSDDQINRDTFRAYRNQKQCDPLKDPGLADLTADVDFGMLRRFIETKAQCYGTVTQRYFLQQMGIEIRLKRLLQSTINNRSAQKELISSVKMLLEDMGTRFKFMAIFAGRSTNQKPVGF